MSVSSARWRTVSQSAYSSWVMRPSPSASMRPYRARIQGLRGYSPPAAAVWRTMSVIPDAERPPLVPADPPVVVGVGHHRQLVPPAPQPVPQGGDRRRVGGLAPQGGQGADVGREAVPREVALRALVGVEDPVVPRLLHVVHQTLPSPSTRPRCGERHDIAGRPTGGGADVGVEVEDVVGVVGRLHRLEPGVLGAVGGPDPVLLVLHHEVHVAADADRVRHQRRPEVPDPGPLGVEVGGGGRRGDPGDVHHVADGPAATEGGRVLVRPPVGAAQHEDGDERQGATACGRGARR